MIPIQKLLNEQKDKVLEDGMQLLREGEDQISSLQDIILKLIPEHFQSTTSRIMKIMCEQSSNLGRIRQTVEQIEKIEIHEVTQ